jgi:hypothetical protein
MFELLPSILQQEGVEIFELYPGLRIGIATRDPSIICPSAMKLTTTNRPLECTHPTIIIHQKPDSIVRLIKTYDGPESLDRSPHKNPLKTNFVDLMSQIQL